MINDTKAPERIWAWPKKDSWFTAGASDHPIKSAGAKDVAYIRESHVIAAQGALIERAAARMDSEWSYNAGNAVRSFASADATAALEAVRREERERAAKIAREWARNQVSLVPKHSEEYKNGAFQAALGIAAAIRGTTSNEAVQDSGSDK